MISVRRKKGETFESLLRRFHQRVQHSGLLIEVKKRRHFKRKPNARQRKESALHRLRLRMRQAYLAKIGLGDEMTDQRRPSYGGRKRGV